MRPAGVACHGCGGCADAPVHYATEQARDLHALVRPVAATHEALMFAAGSSPNLACIDRRLPQARLFAQALKVRACSALALGSLETPAFVACCWFFSLRHHTLPADKIGCYRRGNTQLGQLRPASRARRET